MTTRTVSLAAIAIFVSLSACTVAPGSAEDTALEEGALTQPAAGEYTSSTLVNGFPLGSCGQNGTSAQRDSDLNDHNAPYVLSWADDACVDVALSPEGCALARDPAECKGYETSLRKIVFPMNTGGTGCLTANEVQRLGTTGARTADIGSVYVMDPKDPASPHLTVGHFRIYQYYGNYQYEMVSPAPFTSGAFASTFPGKTSLDGMRMCFAKTSSTGLGLPVGRTPLSCIGFTNEAKAEAKLGSLPRTGAAYSLYDPNTHHYCPVAFASKP